MTNTKQNSTPRKKKSASPSTTPQMQKNSKKKWNWSPGSRAVVFDDKVGNLREQNLDLVATLVDGVYIGVCTKSWSPSEASFLYPMETALNQKESGESLARDWKWVFGILSRRDNGINDGTTVMKAKSGSKWPFKVIVVVINEDVSVDKVGRHIAASFTKFTKSTDLMENTEKYTYRQCFGSSPEALNHHLLDLDVAKILKALGGYKSKEELMEEEDEVLASFYGTSEYGREFILSLEDENWDNLFEEDRMESP